MRQVVTTGIVLGRINFGETDRIVTVLTPDNGKIRAIAKGVRKSTSKLAGGIELFSLSHITYIEGRGEIKTLISTRLKQHYGNIVKDVDRTMFGYNVLKAINRATEDNAGREYFDLLQTLFKALDNFTISLDNVQLWQDAQLLKLSGHTPNFTTDTNKQPLAEKQRYSFNFDDIAFSPFTTGPFSAGHIKILRLALSAHSPAVLQQVKDSQAVLAECLQLMRIILQQFVRL